MCLCAWPPGVHASSCVRVIACATVAKSCSALAGWITACTHARTHGARSTHTQARAHDTLCTHALEYARICACACTHTRTHAHALGARTTGARTRRQHARATALHRSTHRSTQKRTYARTGAQAYMLASLQSTKGVLPYEHSVVGWA